MSRHYTITNISVVRNNGVETCGDVTLTNSCMWISICDYLLLKGHSVTALGLRRMSGITGEYNNMWDNEIDSHRRSLFQIAEIFDLSINVHLSERDEDLNLRLNRIPIRFGEGSQDVHIISYGAHFELITSYLDGEDPYNIGVETHKSVPLNTTNNGVLSLIDDNGLISYRPCSAKSAELQQRIAALTKLYIKTVNNMTVDDQLPARLTDLEQRKDCLRKIREPTNDDREDLIETIKQIQILEIELKYQICAGDTLSARAKSIKNRIQAFERIFSVNELEMRLAEIEDQLDSHTQLLREFSKSEQSNDVIISIVQNTRAIGRLEEEKEDLTRALQMFSA